MNKVYRVNTKTAAITCEDLKEEYKDVGNRGLVAKVMINEVNPQCDPLGPENKLIVCTGLLAGSALSTVNRVSVGGKSPLTGGIKESNVGGNLGFLLASHGIKMFIFEDKPENDQWYILKIDKNSQPELIPADAYLGLNTYALVEKMHEEYGENIGILGIGNAGERLYKIASLQAIDFTIKHPSRSAARGGLGAVAGSKKIKAILVEKPIEREKFPYANKELFDQANKKSISFFQQPGAHQALQAESTNGMIDIAGANGQLPTFNFSGKFYPPEMLEKISTGKFVERINMYGGKMSIACQSGCILRCDTVCNNPDGTVKTGGLEYETFATCGPNCGVTDIDLIADMDRISDDLGVDAMEVGCAIAVLMDIGKIPWGDDDAIRDILNQMVEGKTELGKLMGEGTHRLGEAFNAPRIPTCKKQSLCGYDPRNLKGLGITYATNPMGADHTAGNTAGPGDHTNKKGQVELSKVKQVLAATLDNYICMLGCIHLNDAMFAEVMPDIMKGALGGEWDVEKIYDLGRRTLKWELDWNRAAGFTKKDDRLPDFMYEEKSPATNAVFDLTDEELQQVFVF